MKVPASRRDFLQLTSLATASVAIASGTRAHGESPNEKLTVGLIGCGGRGLHDANLFRNIPNVEIAYVCDPDVDAARQPPEPSASTRVMRSAICDGCSTINRSRPSWSAPPITGIPWRRFWRAMRESMFTSKSPFRITFAKVGCWSKRQAQSRAGSARDTESQHTDDDRRREAAT